MNDKVIRLQLRDLALQLRELTGHVAMLARMVGVEQDPETRFIAMKQLENSLLDLKTSVDRLLNDLPPEIRGEGNGG